MKKLLSSLVVCLLALASLSAQSLTNNEYFKRSLELERQAAAAYELGDYDAAADYAIQAQEYAEMSDLYVAKMLLRREATELFQRAQNRYAWAEDPAVDAARRFPDRFVNATLALEEAKVEFAFESYEKAMVQSRLVLDYLAGIAEIPVFPAYFVVREKESLHDCLWRIAELPEVYNDPYLWPKLYEANRSSLPQPNNPDLIRPGMVLRIPSLRGERREGIWDEKASYPVFGED